MLLDDLLAAYKRHPSFAQTLQFLGEAKQGHLHWQGVLGSLRAFLSACLHQQTHKSQLIVLPDREQAEYLQNDLQSLLEGKTVWFFPSPFRNESDFKHLDTQAILDRTQVLNALTKPSRAGIIVVSYPEALFETVIKQQELSSHTFEASVGDKLDLDFLIEFLVRYNFERTDFVFEAGSFSVRGSIIDIFTFAGDLPIRIELFDDTIESIRLFDIETQVSQRKLSRVSIIPNLDNQSDKMMRIPLFDYLPKDSILIVKDLHHIAEQWRSLTLKATQHIADNADAPVIDGEYQLAEDHWISGERLLKIIGQFPSIELGSKAFLVPNLTLAFDTSPQPVFNKNFPLLAENLKANLDKHYQNIIFSDQARQVERIYGIFEDMGLAKNGDTLFQPIYKVLHEGFIDHTLKLVCYTEHQIFGRFQRYKGKKNFKKSEALTIKELYDLKPGDLVTHIDHGVGVFSGLEKMDVNGQQQEAVRLKYSGGDLLYVNIHSLHKIARFQGQEGKPPKLNKLGSQTWENLKAKTKAKVKDIARDLIRLYAMRKAAKGFQFSPDGYMQTELEASFMYEDTPDQAKATEDVKRDMEAPFPMDRLVCGDVGFGKTEVAIRAAFKAVTDGKQVAILVPTTVLASQHYKTFKARLERFPVTIDFLSRFKTATQQKATIKNLEQGKVDILIGTHRILSKDLKFKDLGLLIVDEEQKFGVASKEKLRATKSNIDTLVLSATPIPRTLSFSLMGARDMSTINTPPPNRRPVKTHIEVFDHKLIRDAIDLELERRGQVFFVHNRIKDLFDMGDLIQSLCPQAKVAVAHAQMEADKLEEIMLNFIEGYYDVLVSTNIIEAGLDIPNANTIIINQAQNHGLSDLYQLRGRVGRSDRKAYCYLLTPPSSVLSTDARKRLSVLEEFSDLGSGFHVAMRDMDIRGAGNLLGGEQSGFINEIGLEMYQKILREAVNELKDSEFKELFKDETPKYESEINIDADLEMHLPDHYVASIQERLGLYNRLNLITTEAGLQEFATELIDRFGKIPKPTLELLDMVRLKWICQRLLIEKITIKRTRLKASFSNKADERFFQTEDFSHIIEYVQKHHQRVKLEQKDKQLFLHMSDIHTVKSALSQFSHMLALPQAVSS